MKYYIALVTGGEYFLTPCVIIKAQDEEAAQGELRAHNRASRRYMIALDRIGHDEIESYQEQGAHVAETPEDIANAF